MPVQESFEIALLPTAPFPACEDSGRASWNMRLRSRGTDQDHDILLLDYYLADASDRRYIFTSGGGAVDFPMVTSYGEGDSYDGFTTILTCDLVAQGIVALAGGVEDAQGNTSELIVFDLDDIVVVPELAVDAACDPAGIDDVCPVGTACQVQSDLTSACTSTSTAPTLTELIVTRISDTGIRLTVSGTDPEGDVIGLTVTFTDDTGEVVLIDSTEFDFSRPPTGGATWTASLELFFGSPIELVEYTVDDDTYSPGQVTAIARDSQGNLSEEELSALIPLLVPGDLGDPCDLSGVLEYCLEGLLCKRNAVGAGVCDIAELALRTFTVEFFEDLTDIGVDPGPGYLFHFVAEADPSADDNDSLVAFLVTAFVASDYDDNYMFLLYDDGGATEVGEYVVELFGYIRANGDVSETHFYAQAVTFNNDLSNELMASVTPTRLDTQICDTTLLIDVCEQRYVCSAETEVCVLGTAPVLAAVTSQRTGVREFVFEVDGSDADADGVGFVAALLNDGGAPIFLDEGWFVTIAGQKYGFDASIFGMSEFPGDGEPVLGRITFEEMNPPDDVLLSVTDLEITLYDSSGRRSDPMSIPVLPVTLDICSLDADALPCYPGSVCDADAGDDPRCLPRDGSDCNLDDTYPACATDVYCDADSTCVTERLFLDECVLDGDVPCEDGTTCSDREEGLEIPLCLGLSGWGCDTADDCELGLTCEGDPLVCTG
jgi:hypothetical protein